MRSSLIAAVLMLLAGQAFAASGFRGEIGGGYIDGSSGISGYQIPEPGEPGEPGQPGQSPGLSADYDGWQVNGRAYLDTVDNAGGPARLRPFLNRASHVGARYQTIESDSGVDADTWRIDTRLIWNAWVAEAEFGQADAGVEGVASDADAWRAAVGYYLARGTQLRGAYETLDGDGGFDTSRYAIDVTHVQQLSNGMTWSVNALAALVDEDTAFGSDDGTDIELTLDWFFNDAFGVGTELVFANRDDGADAESWEVYGDYWITEKISLRLAYVEQDVDDAGLEADAWTFDVVYRR